MRSYAIVVEPRGLLIPREAVDFQQVDWEQIMYGSANEDVVRRIRCCCA